MALKCSLSNGVDCSIEMDKSSFMATRWHANKRISRVNVVFGDQRRPKDMLYDLFICHVAEDSARFLGLWPKGPAVSM